MHRLDGIDAGNDKAERMTITWEAPKAVNTLPAPVSLARQAGIGLAALLGYLLVRDAAGAADARAQSNARAVEGLERSAGLLREEWLRERAAGSALLSGALEWVYTYGHWLAAAAVLVWLARRHPAVYYRARDTMLLVAAGALFVFVVFPVAPPSDGGAFAALPSLHAGWDVVVGLAIAAAARRAWVRSAGVGLAAAMAASVVLTGHHHLLDVLAGAALTAACWLYLRARRRPAALRGYAGWDGLELH
ncbi:MAG TPA: phosphatase PAP2 family protein [Dactylosporangium sp.]|nr:phosphatase PAP2 family protein [Dactylosporangium sp.]